MPSVPFTFRIDPEMKASLEAAASASDRTPGYLAKKAISAFLQAREEKRLAIEAAIIKADRGLLVPDEAVDAWLDSLDSDEPLEMPKASDYV